MKPSYCTQNDGKCLSCSLSNYGRDCMNNPIRAELYAASTLGRTKSEAKSKASAENGKLGGRPKFYVAQEFNPDTDGWDNVGTSPLGKGEAEKVRADHERWAKDDKSGKTYRVKPVYLK